MHEPLSRTLARISGELAPGRPATLNQVIDRTGGRGPFALLIVLSLPFVTPVSLPGISNILGVVMCVIAWKLLRGVPAHLPKRVGERPMQHDRMTKILRVSARVLAFIEKWARPRRSPWLAWRPVRLANAAAVGVMALMLALPIPPTIPLSNMLPGYSIILLAMSLMEEDGVLIWAAYVASLGTLIYLVAMIVIQAEAIVLLYSKFFHRIAGPFQ
jgi:hypothetical protein